MLINKYIDVHAMIKTPISAEKANEDLIKLYKEFYDILGPYACDSVVLEKLHKVIIDYENDEICKIVSLSLSNS